MNSQCSCNILSRDLQELGWRYWIRYFKRILELPSTDNILSKYCLDRRHYRWVTKCILGTDKTHTLLSLSNTHTCLNKKLSIIPNNSIPYHYCIINKNQTAVILTSLVRFIAFLDKSPRNYILTKWKNSGFKNGYDVEERNGNISVSILAVEGDLNWSDRNSNSEFHVNECNQCFDLRFLPNIFWPQFSYLEN